MPCTQDRLAVLRGRSHMILESFGVLLALTVPRSIVADLEPVIPPGARQHRRGTASAQFSIEETRGGYVVQADGEELITSHDLELCLAVLDPVVRQVVALNAPDHIFIHA